MLQFILGEKITISNQISFWSLLRFIFLTKNPVFATGQALTI